MKLIRIAGTFIATALLALASGVALGQGGVPSGPWYVWAGDRFPSGQKPEAATPEEIVALVGKLGPGVYHRLSGCVPPPPWGFGSPADEAAAHLVRIGAPVFPYVMPLAQSKDEATRALVIEVLGRIGDDRAVPILIDACLRDTSDRVRQSAAEELSWSKDPRVGPALVPALQDRNRQTQLFAVRGLFKHPQEDAIGPLLALMGHAAESMPSIGPYTSPAMVAESAAYALGAIGPKAYAPILGLLASSDPAVRNVGATALTECNDRRAIPKLIELCDAPDDPTRLRAAYALGRWSDPDSVVRLTRLMHFGTGYSAGMAAQSLARIGGSALDPVFAAARDKDPALREMAMNGFLSIEDRSAAPRLVEILNTDDVRVREMALFKLSMWLDVRALPQIVVMASDPDMERRRLAIGMLSNYSDAGHPEIIPPLLAGMTDANESVRSQAAGALFGKRDRRIGPAMRALLKSPIKDVPPLAEMVLKQYRR